MLYIASAQPPTPILQSQQVADFTSQGSSSLVVAKPDRVEVWDVGPSGLVFQVDLEVWGSVVGIEKVITRDARPHILVLLGPPNAQLLVLTYNPSTSSLVVTSSTLLNPPTPSLRQAEFYRGVVLEGSMALVSLWVGVLSCIELEVEKEKDLKRRRSSAVTPMLAEAVPDKRLRVKESFNINVREQNLLSLAFHTGPSTIHGPVLSMLALSPHNEIELYFRSLSVQTQSLMDLGKPLNVVITPQAGASSPTAEVNYGSIPFSCPGARHVVPVGVLGDERLLLVVGDEYTVLYSFSQVDRREQEMSSSSQSYTTSPRASAISRSPQSELKQIGKRRKSSTTDSGVRWQVNPIWRLKQGFGTVLSATAIESTKSGGKVILSDDSGRLTAFSWAFDYDTDNFRSVRVGKTDLGLSSPASSLTVLDDAHLFCASTCGDSTLLRHDIPAPGPPSSPIAPSSSPRTSKIKGKGKEEANSSISVSEPGMGSIETLERWVNLAPVKDFCAVGNQSGGTSHLVLASGSSNSNSLRVVRSGAGLERLACIEGLQGVERVWSLDLAGNGSSSLLYSTAISTSLLNLSPEVTEFDLVSNIASTPTLAAAILPSTKTLIHITPTAITLWDDLEAGNSTATWQSPGEITSAQISEGTIIVSTVGGDVHVLKATSGKLDCIATGNVGAEVSSVAILSNDGLSSPIIAIGTWSNAITVYIPDQLKSGSPPLATMTESFFPSSLLLRSGSDANLQLLAGLSDGSLVIYDLVSDPSIASSSLSMRDRKISSLGTQPLTLHPIQSRTASGDNLLAFGLSDRASILFVTGDRIDFSSVSTTGIVAAAAVQTPEDGQSLVLASPTDLSISQVDGLKKLHIQTLDTGYQSASKVVWSSTHRAIATGVVERTIDPVTGDYCQNAWFEMRDQDTLQVLTSLPLELREEITSLSEVLLSDHHYIAVGTALLSEDQDDDLVYEENIHPAKTGRLLLLDPVLDRSTGTWTLNTVTQITTIGAVNDITVIHEFLAYAAASKVSIMKFEDDALQELSSFSSTFIAHSLFTAPPSKYQAEEKLIVGDGMRSVLMLEIDDESGMIYGDDRDMATHQVVALAGIKDRGQGVVVADGSSNILTFRLRDRVESAATFGLHEQVVKFSQGSFAPPASAPEVIAPDLIYATTDGRLGMIGELSLPSAKILDDLQRNMDKYQKGPGGVSWRQFRRGGKALVPRDTAGFIDGDFVQQFLKLDAGNGQMGEKVLKGGSLPEQITKFGPGGKAESASRADVARVLEAAAGFH